MAAIDELFGFDFANDGLSPGARRRLGVAQQEASRGAARSVAAALGQGSTNPLAASNAYQEATRDARTGALRTVLEQEEQRRAAQLAMARQAIGSLITSGGQAVGMAIPAAPPITGAATNAATGALESSGATSALTGTAPAASSSSAGAGASPAVARLLQAPPSAPARSSAPLTAAPAATPAPVAPSTPDTSAVGQLLRSSLGSGPLIAPPATPTQASLTGAAPALVGTGVTPRPPGTLEDPLDELARLYPGSVQRVR